jgi:hypothetical protein
MLFVVLGCSLIVLLASMAYSQRKMQESEIEFAQESLKMYVENVLDEENFANFGFKSLQEAQVARVGDPYRVMFIGLQDLKAYKPGTGARPLLRDAKTLWFPVMVEGETRTKLEIVEKDGKWIAGEFGGIGTVQKATMARAQLPKLLESKEVKEPQEPVLVKIPALHAMFLYVESPRGEFLVPAMFQPQRFELQEAQIYTADEALSKLSEFAQEIDENKIG